MTARHKAIYVLGAGILIAGSAHAENSAAAQNHSFDISQSATATALPQATASPSPPLAPPINPSIPAGSAPQSASAPVKLPGASEPQEQAQPAAADIVVTGKAPVHVEDPLQAVNVKSFKVTEKVDAAVMAPVALAYRHNIPDPIRTGIRNFLKNLHEPVVMLNFVLQHKIGKAAETVARFGINSTLGLAGVIDVAAKRPFRLPRRPNGFADTLGFYGVKSGPFFYVPLIGPTTLRDFTGDMLDRLVLPISVGEVFKNAAFTVPATTLGVIDRRAQFDSKLHELHDDRSDAYQASRRYYLERRQAEIDELRGPRRSKKPEPVAHRFGITATGI